jgi:large subunit ribosomal protein L25
MDQREITVEARTRTGKNSARQIRAEGLIPGIIYGKGIDPVPVTVKPKELATALSGESGMNTILKLKGGEHEGGLVIVTELLRDSLKRTMLHVDLHKLNMDNKIRVHVPVRLVGSPIGVKEGGLLDFATHSLDIECLPTQIPEHIDVDVTDLSIGQSIHVSDLKLATGVKALLESRASIVSILGRAKEEEAPAAAV